MEDETLGGPLILRNNNRVGRHKYLVFYFLPCPLGACVGGTTQGKIHDDILIRVIPTPYPYKTTYCSNDTTSKGEKKIGCGNASSFMRIPLQWNLLFCITMNLQIITFPRIFYLQKSVSVNNVSPYRERCPSSPYPILHDCKQRGLQITSTSLSSICGRRSNIFLSCLLYL